MVNQEQLEIIKQGVDVWNTWRNKNPNAKIDLLLVDLAEANLGGADLRGANLGGADLSESNLREADLSGADLRIAQFNGADLRKANLAGANLSEANLSEVWLIEADLSGADLSVVELSRANLTGANLSEANLSKANFRYADLSDAKLIRTNLTGARLIDVDLFQTDLNGADLSGANLKGANLKGANLKGANLRNAELGHAKLVRTELINANLSYAIINDVSLLGVDLSTCTGLETIVHLSPSHISTSSIERSKGQIPVEFLRGCGLSDWEIESAKLYNPKLNNQEISELQYKIYDLRATRSIQVSPLFISYSHADSSFVDELGKKLTEMGIRYWRDIHDMKTGRMETQVDRAIRLNPTVLVVLSKHSIKSDWVEHEVNTARELEKELNRDCLCPVALDDSWTSSPWDQRIMRQVKKYNILDFSNWQDKSTFEMTFKKLVDGLQLFYK